MIFELRNPKYYIRTFLGNTKFMEVGEEYMEVQEETILFYAIRPNHEILNNLIQFI